MNQEQLDLLDRFAIMAWPVLMRTGEYPTRQHAAEDAYLAACEMMDSRQFWIRCVRGEIPEETDHDGSNWGGLGEIPDASSPRRS